MHRPRLQYPSHIRQSLVNPELEQIKLIERTRDKLLRVRYGAGYGTCGNGAVNASLQVYIVEQRADAGGTVAILGPGHRHFLKVGHGRVHTFSAFVIGSQVDVHLLERIIVSYAESESRLYRTTDRILSRNQCVGMIYGPLNDRSDDYVRYPE